MSGYAEYKEVGSRWVEYVPASWTFSKIAEVFIERKEKNNPIKTTDILSLTNTRGVIPYKEKGNIGNKAKEDLTGYRLAYPGDIVFNSMNAVIGSVGLSKYFGAVSPVYYMLYLRDAVTNNIRYFDYVFRNKTFQNGLNGLGNGILEIRMRIPMSKLKYVCVPVPPREEQEQIVRFLDWKVSGIHKLINNKRKEIAELEAYKLRCITDKVTTGLSFEKNMKPTTSKWIKSVPSHWDIVSVRRAYSVILGKMLAPTMAGKSDSLDEYVCAKDVHFEGVSLSDLKKMWFSPSEREQYRIYDGDLLVVEGGAGAGNTAIVHKTPDRDIYVQNSIHIVRAKSGVAINEYLYFWLYSLVKRGYMKSVCSVATIPHYTKDKVLSTIMPLPPLNEQEEIVDYLKKRCSQIDAAIASIESSIKELKELRTRLVADVVTGQMDVRDIEIPAYELVEGSAEVDAEETEELQDWHD